jgi:hypothetical protein
VSFFDLAGGGVVGKRLEEAEARSCAVGKIWRQDDDDGARLAVFFPLAWPGEEWKGQGLGGTVR